MGNKNQRSGQKRIGMLYKLLASGLVAVLVLGVALAVVPEVFPNVGADIAERLRTVFGPQPVAMLESISFQLQDKINSFRSEVDGGQVQINVSSQLPNNPDQVSTPAIEPSPTSQSPNIPSAQDIQNPPVNVVTDAPDLGWQAYGPMVQGNPVMAQAVVKLDPQRPYAAIVLVRIDLSKIQLHIMPGTLEPPHPAQIKQFIPNLGAVPLQEQDKLLVAFNGGFRSIHGHYGMTVNDVSLLPPVPGIATLAIYRDGHVQLGTWGRDINPSADMLAFRQNCPPLIELGTINPDLSIIDKDAWGYTNNLDITWRTGLGITQDGHYLIYAVGNGNSAETLAEAFVAAGAYNAMQLDINQFYAHFYTYQPSDPATSKGFRFTGERLVDQMINNPHLYLTPNERDFFYITLR